MILPLATELTFHPDHLDTNGERCPDALRSVKAAAGTPCRWGHIDGDSVNHKPTQRYATAHDVTTALHTVLDDEALDDFEEVIGIRPLRIHRTDMAKLTVEFENGQKFTFIIKE